MASMVESKVVFRSRAKDLGLDDATIGDMATRGWNSFGSFGFSCSYVPGQQDDSSFKADVLAPLFGADGSPMVPNVRRLYFEAYTVAAMEMRTSLNRTAADPPRTMPQPEREQRFQALRATLPGMACTGVHEPADSLVDRMAQMLERGRLLYIAWQDCPSKDQEGANVKVDRFWKPDSAGHLKETIVPLAVNADTSTDLKLMQALTRRGMAFHMAHLMNFATHEKLKHLLMEELAREPPSNEWAWVSVTQLARADREIFRLLGEACRSGLGPNASGVRPLDACMDRVLDTTSVRVMLLHMPAAGSKRTVTDTSAVRSSAGSETGTGKSAQAKKRARKAAAKIAAPPPPPQHAAKRPQGAKAASKGGSNFVPMPAALRGLNAKTPDGSSICFAYNLPGGCNTSSCQKGKHVCAKCFGPHSFQDCQP